MLALRRASASHRVRFCLGSQFFSVKSGSSVVCLDGKASSVLGFPRFESDNLIAFKKFYHSGRSACDCGFGCRRCFSTRAGIEESDKEEDDGLSELDTPKLSETGLETGVADEVLTSESELSDDDDDDVDGLKAPTSEDLDLLPTDNEKKSRKMRSPELFKAILSAPGLSIGSALDKYIEDGKEVNSSDIADAMFRLRQRRMFGRALQLSEWLEKNKLIEFNEKEYASRLDLLVKVRGIHKGESYINSIPESFRGELIYRTLLANIVVLGNGRKAEEIFNKMRDMDFPLSSFSYNQLLILYMRTDKKKIADVLLLMEQENVKPTPFTYKILIETKGQTSDLTGMEQLVETMKSDGMEPDISTLTLMAKHYIRGGLKDKALKLMKQIEGDDLKANRPACAYLLPLYASLGDANEVKRIWEVCESRPYLPECMGAIEAWGRLKNVEEAERVFDKMLQTSKRISAKQYNSLLKVYVDNKMLAKGKELVNKMGELGCTIGPYTWDALVKMYVEAGEVEKADAILQKAAEKTRLKPMYSSYMYIMEHYANKGDVHNTEKMFHRLRLAGYISRIKPFQALAQAYINSKTPAYGMRERLKADNLFPNKPLAAQLVQIDAFKKTAVSDLLD
ncbi:unnamed protein product [Rhodiola kirilowii]